MNIVVSECTPATDEVDGILSQIGVAFISSKESFKMHVFLFCSFAAFYLTHLLLTCWIITRFEPSTAEEDLSRR